MPSHLSIKEKEAIENEWSKFIDTLTSDQKAMLYRLIDIHTDYSTYGGMKSSLKMILTSIARRS